MHTIVAEADQPGPADGASSEEGEAERALRLRSRVHSFVSGPFGVALLAMVIVSIAVLQANAGGSWRPPFFFDEVWRVDFIRSSHPLERMYTHDTPIPVGWVALMHVITAPLPYKPVVFRVISVGWFMLAVGVLTVLFARITQRAPHGRSFLERIRVDRPAWMSRPIPLLAAPAGVAMICFTPRVSHFFQYFNNYTFEILYIALIVLAAEELDRTPRLAFPGLCILLALSPLFVIGGLFALPALVVCAAIWCWRSAPARRRPRLAALSAGCVGAASSMALVWVKVYKPVAGKPSISKFWIEERAAVGGDVTLPELLGKTVKQWASGMIGDRLYFVGAENAIPQFGPVQLIAYAILGVSTAVGVVAVWRRWPWLVGVIGSAWVLTVTASVLARWPMTIERVNLCWQILFFVLAGYGMARSVLWFTPNHPSLGVPALLVVFALLWYPPYDVGIDAFSRNLTYDLQPVGDSPGMRNVVFQYHPLAHFYADNDLVNTDHGDRTFEIVAENPGEEWLYAPLDSVLRDKSVSSGDIVWCVMPLELGDKTYEACRFDDPSRLELVSEYSGRGAAVRGYRVR